MAKDELIANALKASRTPKSKAPAKKTVGASGSIVASAANAPRRTPTNTDADEDNFWNTPVVKGLLDAISTGVYSVGNWTDFASAGEDKKAEILREGMDAVKRGDMLGGIIDIIGSRNPQSAAVPGLLKGISAGLGGNDSDTNTFANTVVNLQRNAGIDTESPESKTVQGALGFTGDVLFDPLNVVGLGVPVKGIRGAQIGAKKFKEADALSKKEGIPLPEYIAPTKWENAKKYADEEIFKYRKAQYDTQQARIGARELKKAGTDTKKADFLIENVHSLRKGVYKSLLKTMDTADPEAFVTARLMEKGNADDLMEALAKAGDEIPDQIMDPRDIEPNVEPHLGQIKKLTTEQKLADELGKMRTTNRAPIYKPEVAANVAKLKEVKKRPTNKDFENLGIKPEHIAKAKAGRVEDITEDISTGDVRKIVRDIQKGLLPTENFYDIIGTKDPKEVAGYLKDLMKNKDQYAAFKEAASELGKYGTHRTGETPLPYLGVSGHGKLATPGYGSTPADIRAAKFATKPEDARQFLEQKYKFHATELARNPKGAELRVIADNIFHKVIGDQRTPAGPLVSPRGASVAETLDAAKWETRWNTHSNIFRIAETTKAVRALFKGHFRGTDYDTAWMQVLSDVDNRLRLAGLDPHLSNMKMRGDKLVVRLAPSDVFRAMKPQDRIKFIHGNLRNTGTSIKEYLPSTILDMAEVLVRSATKLKPDGTIDTDFLLKAAIQTLNGRYSKVMPGLREISANLDVFTYNKANFEILQSIDRKLATTYAKQFKDTSSQLEKIRLLHQVQNAAPELFKGLSLNRMHLVPQQLYFKFTKGMTSTGSESNILTYLINTNMRNASVFGGSVAREIGEASAEQTAKILDALNNGNAGEFLSELVVRPPYSSSDAAARAIVSENQRLVQRSVATEGELKGAYAFNRNVEGTGKPAANNGEAFQRSDEIDLEMAKDPLAINKEILFDLTLREANKDMLYKIYGPHRFFNRRAGMPTSYDTVVGSAHASSLIMTGMHGVIRNWRARGITSEQLRVAMQTLKQPGAAQDALSAELQDVMNALFNPNVNNFFSRNSVGPAHFNRILEDVKFDEKFRVNETLLPADATEAQIAAAAEEMNNVWRTWDITNVEDFISKITGAMIKTAEDVSVGAAITSKFGKSVPQKGYVKLVDPKGMNTLFKLVDTDLYYPIELADEFVHIGRMLTESRSFKPGTGWHTFITKILDPVISSLKMSQTTLKPGHHVMSVIGDAWRNSLALSQLGVTNPATVVKLYFESARILRANLGPIRELDELGKFQRLQGLTTEIKIRNDGTGAEFFGNIGKGGQINRTKLYELMQAKGVALPAHLGGQMEDFLTHFDQLDGFGKKTGNLAIDTVGKVTSGLDRVANPLSGKYSLNAFTAHRDTWSRGVIFLGAMRSKKFRTVEEAADFAADQVKKWAPTALDLGAMESKVARRVIFYYTWIRGMVPRMVESTLLTPGMVTVPNKLMYNIALANGIDPSSIGDPFPEGTLFPEWYQERVIGPQYEVDGDLWGANPTGPWGDIANTLGSNVTPEDFLGADAFTKTAGTFLNMSTPFFRAPWELTTGRTIERGIPILDRAQYLQDMFGPARFVSKASGKDLYPAIGPDGVTLPNRTEKKYARGMTDEERGQNALPELLNWASGLNFTNYTSDAAQNSAYYQRRDERAQERKRQQRLEG